MECWLPDLEAGEFANQISVMYPAVDVLGFDGETMAGGVKSPRRNELLHALREAATTAPVKDAVRAIAASDTGARQPALIGVPAGRSDTERRTEEIPSTSSTMRDAVQPAAVSPDAVHVVPKNEEVVAAIEGMIGSSAIMMELTRLIRLVAPTAATVLIEGETGTKVRKWWQSALPAKHESE